MVKWLDGGVNCIIKAILMDTLNIPLFYRRLKISHLPPDMALCFYRQRLKLPISEQNSMVGHCSSIVLGFIKETSGPWATICTPDKNSYCIFAKPMQHSSSTATATGTQIWPYHKKVKGHPYLIILTNLVDLESAMLYIKIQPFLVLEKKIFKCF